ncbi:MAG TPA: hypothetical protein VME18_06415 [Acidobacteriaceae bacterium]|nr:hypothetical protein [Acidobacteriaceae bacterium]
MPAHRLRSEQASGILLVAAVILLVARLRADRRIFFPPGRWRW